MDKTGQKNEQASKMPGSDSTDTTLESKLEKLGSILSGYGKMTVALSGGVDSAFLPVSYTHLDVYKRQWYVCSGPTSMCR